MLKRKDIRP